MRGGDLVYINESAQRVTFDRDMALSVCDTLATGYSLTQTCQKHPAFPSARTFRLWLAGRGVSEDDCDWLREEFIVAELARADAFVDDCLDIADNGTNDYMEEERKDGSTFFKINSEAIQRSKLRIDTRLWAASRLNPEKYGAKAILTVKVKPMKADAREARIIELFEKCAVALPPPKVINPDD